MLDGAVTVEQMKPNSFSGADTPVALVAWLAHGPLLQEGSCVLCTYKRDLPGIGCA